MPETWKRHDLLLVEPRALTRVLSEHPPFAAFPLAAQWAAHGWPLIVRRRLHGDDPRRIPVGLPLPPSVGKLRLGAQIYPEDVSGRVPSVLLRGIRENAPRSWWRTIDSLLELAEQIGVEPRVFGSLLWQRLTSLSYLSANSDLDLLWPLADHDTAARLVRGLHAIEQHSPMRCDGEIFLSDGSGVQWREWHQASTEVLVKTSSGVRLCAPREVFSEAACPP